MRRGGGKKERYKANSGGDHLCYAGCDSLKRIVVAMRIFLRADKAQHSIEYGKYIIVANESGTVTTMEFRRLSISLISTLKIERAAAASAAAFAQRLR
jgi:hypothetical protein